MRSLLFFHLIMRGWIADPPLEQLPEVHLLPGSIQAKVFFLCDADSQKTLSAAFSCFRPFWHERRPYGDRFVRSRSACEAWHELELEESSVMLSNLCMRAQVVKKAIHRAPEAHGSSTLHCCVQGHFDTQQLAYILQLPAGDQLRCLGFKIGRRVLDYMDCPDHHFESDDLGESMFMSFHLSCRKQAGLSDGQLEHLENLFYRLPEAFIDFSSRHQEWLSLACEPRWSCSTCPASCAAMRWHIPDGEITFTAEALDLIV